MDMKQSSLVGSLAEEDCATGGLYRGSLCFFSLFPEDMANGLLLPLLALWEMFPVRDEEEDDDDEFIHTVCLSLSLSLSLSFFNPRQIDIVYVRHTIIQLT